MTVSLIPREVLFGNPRRLSPALSPDGARLAYLSPDEGVLNVWVGRIGSPDFRPVTHDCGRGVASYFWAPDNRHLLYLQDTEGDENWRLRSVDLISGEAHGRDHADCNWLVTYTVDDGPITYHEGHDLIRPENRLRFYAAAERFLGKHVGGHVEP